MAAGGTGRRASSVIDAARRLASGTSSVAEVMSSAARLVGHILQVGYEILQQLWKISPELATVVVGLGLAAVAVATFVAAVNAAAHAIHALRAAAIVSGGNYRSVTALSLLGLDPASIANAGAQFRANSMTGQGAVALSWLGMPFPGPRIAGNTDEAGPLLEALTLLRGVTDKEEQLQLARMAGLQEFLPVLQASDRVWSKLGQDLYVTNRIAESTDQQATDLVVTWNRLKQAVSNFLMAALSPWFPELQNLEEGLISTLNVMALWITEHKALFKAIVEGILIIPTVIRWIDKLSEGIGKIGEFFEGLWQAFRAGAFRFIGTIVHMWASLMYMIKTGDFRAGTQGTTGVQSPADRAGQEAMEEYFRARGFRSFDAGGYPLKGVPEDEAKIVSGSTPMDRHATAMARHSSAMDAHTAALDPGIFGGGERARGAFPSALRSFELDRAQRGRALSLGVFVA